MAYIYMAGGAVLKVQGSLDSVVTNLANHSDPFKMVIDFPAGGGRAPGHVMINPKMVSVVSDLVLPVPREVASAIHL